MQKQEKKEGDAMCNCISPFFVLDFRYYRRKIIYLGLRYKKGAVDSKPDFLVIKNLLRCSCHQVTARTKSVKEFFVEFCFGIRAKVDNDISAENNIYPRLKAVLNQV